MNQQALVAIGRRNPEVIGRSPFSLCGSGFCIDGDGVVVTASHVLERFLRRWSTIDIPSRGHSAAVAHQLQLDELPHITFRDLEAPGEGRAFPMQSLAGNVDDDVAVVELGVESWLRPLPVATTTDHVPAVGDAVGLLANFEAPAMPTDPDGHPLSYGLTYQNATVVAHDQSGFYIDYPVAQGMSGGPVFLPSTGDVCGIILESWRPARAAAKLRLHHAVSRIAVVESALKHLPSLRAGALRRSQAGGNPWCGRAR